MFVYFLSRFFSSVWNDTVRCHSKPGLFIEGSRSILTFKVSSAELKRDFSGQEMAKVCFEISSKSKACSINSYFGVLWGRVTAFLDTRTAYSITDPEPKGRYLFFFRCECGPDRWLKKMLFPLYLHFKDLFFFHQISAFLLLRRIDHRKKKMEVISLYHHSEDCVLLVQLGTWPVHVLSIMLVLDENVEVIWWLFEKNHTMIWDGRDLSRSSSPLRRDGQGHLP